MDFSSNIFLEIISDKKKCTYIPTSTIEKKKD
jgi:hypothetical protein